MLENSTNVQYSEAEKQSENAVHIPKSSAVKFHGFNIPCLAKPKACHGNFMLKFFLSFTNETDEGIIFSTSGFNTSVVGTSLFLKNSKLIASIRTKSREWKASAPMNMAVNAFQIIKINWGYNEAIKLTIDTDTYIETYMTVSHIPESGEDLNGVLSVGGIDMLLRFSAFKVEDYDGEWSKRVQYGGKNS